MCAFHVIFDITNNFALPVDAVLGMNSLKELHKIISAERNVVIYQGKHLVGMETPSPLASQVFSDKDSQPTVEQTHTVAPIDIRE